MTRIHLYLVCVGVDLFAFDERRSVACISESSVGNNNPTYIGD